METKHNADCKRVWKRYDATCPRCQELIAGAEPRTGWGLPPALRAHNERMDRLAHDAHYAPGGPHARGTCGPVCTFGDY